MQRRMVETPIVAHTYVEKKTFADQTLAEILFVDREFQELKERLLKVIDVFDVAHHQFDLLLGEQICSLTHLLHIALE